MTDIREITVTATTTYKVNVARFFTEYDDEWNDFREGKNNNELREEFIRDTAAELGRDLEDFNEGGFFDTEYEVEVLRPS